MRIATILTTLTAGIILLSSVTGCESDEEKADREWQANRKKQAEEHRKRWDIDLLSEGLELYRLDNHKYPTQEQGLNALVQKPTIEPIPKYYRAGGYMKKLPKDQWGNDYIYVIPGTHKNNKFDLFSAGPDGKPGTDDDIGNW